MGSLEYNNSSDWIDITEEFRNAAQQLKLGELVHDERFGLYDAMAAIELMDPKMDAGMAVNKTRKPFKFEEMIKNGMVKIDDFTPQELIGIMDDTFGCLVTWLNGHSLAQTVFINVFLHNPSLICDRTLKTFCIVILKIVDMIIDFVLKASVFEEEDFQPKPYGFDLATATNISKIVPMIKAVEDEIKSEIEKIRQNGRVDECKFNDALLTRFKFTKYFFLCLYTFKKYLYKQNALPCQELVQQLTENLDSCENLFDSWIETIDDGIKPKEPIDTDSNRPDYPTIMGFEPLVNQRLLAPSFPRYTKIKSRIETVQYMKEFLKRIRTILKLKDVDKFVDVIKFFDDFSMQSPSCAVSRSLLQLFYLPQPNNPMVFGETEFIEMVKESCRQFIKPPSLRAKNTLTPNCKELMETFFERCSIFFKLVIQIYGHNRASQRGKLAMVLKDLIFMIEECTALEQYLSNKSFCDHLQIWVLFYKFYFMSQYLLSGFELELYSIHEYAYMYFELDHLWEFMTIILRRAQEVYQEHDIFLNNVANSNNLNSKARKKNKTKNKKYMHETLIIYYKAMNLMAAAFHYVLMAFHINNKIPPLTQSLNSEEIRYNRRFLPLLQFEGTLQSYNKYKNRYDSLAKTWPAKQLYFKSCQLFKDARDQFEMLKDSSFREKVQPYIKVAKTNSVVLMLLFSGHKDQGKIEFNFSEAIYFPIIKFTT